MFWLSTKVVTALFSCYMVGAMWNCCRLATSSVHTTQPCTSLQCHYIQYQDKISTERWPWRRKLSCQDLNPRSFIFVSPSLYHWAIPHFISVSTSELLNLAISAHLLCHFTFICTYLIWAVAASDCAPTRGLLWSRACDRDGGDARQWGSAGPWWESSSQSARHFAVGVTRAFKVLLVSSCSQDELC